MSENKNMSDLENSQRDKAIAILKILNGITFQNWELLKKDMDELFQSRFVLNIDDCLR